MELLDWVKRAICANVSPSRTRTSSLLPRLPTETVGQVEGSSALQVKDEIETVLPSTW